MAPLTGSAPWPPRMESVENPNCRDMIPYSLTERPLDCLWIDRSSRFTSRHEKTASVQAGRRGVAVKGQTVGISLSPPGRTHHGPAEAWPCTWTFGGAFGARRVRWTRCLENMSTNRTPHFVSGISCQRFQRICRCFSEVKSTGIARPVDPVTYPPPRFAVDHPLADQWRRPCCAPWPPPAAAAHPSTPRTRGRSNSAVRPITLPPVADALPR